MNRRRWIFPVALAGAIALSSGLLASPALADHGSLRAEVGIYYDELSPYGDWVDDTQYGAAWCPRHVGSDWRPYSDGRWVDSDYGWTWVTDEPFGWATYHYGRWAFDPRYGWIWVPGTVWAPAWVSWQYGGGYVGWAPLPPSVGFDLNVGIRLGGLSLTAALSPNDYVFVSERGFLEPNVGRYAVPRVRNRDLWRRARNVTNYTVINHRVINRGVTVNEISRATRRPVPRYRISEVESRRSIGVERDRVRIYRPSSSQLRTSRVAVRNDSGVRPHGRPTVRPDVRRIDRPAENRGRGPAVRPNERYRRPEARPQPPPQTRRVEVRRTEVRREEVRREQVRRTQVAPRQHGTPPPRVNRPTPRENHRPEVRKERHEQRPSARPNRPHGGGGGSGGHGAAKPKQHGHGG